MTERHNMRSAATALENGSPGLHDLGKANQSDFRLIEDDESSEQYLSEEKRGNELNAASSIGSDHLIPHRARDEEEVLGRIIIF